MIALALAATGGFLLRDSDLSQNLLTRFSLGSSAAPDEPAAAAAGGPPPITVVFAEVRRRDVERLVSTIGDTRARETTTLSPRVAGRITEILFSEGAWVGAGDLLVRLDPAEVEAEVLVERAQVAELRQALSRAEELAASGSGTVALVEDLRLRLQAAEAALAADTERLEDFELRAPFAGRVGLRDVSPGTLVQPGDALVSLDATDPMDLRFSVPERFLASLMAGSEVEATTDAFPDRSFKGTVRAIERRVDPVLRTVRLEAELLNQDESLVPGMLMKVSLAIGVARSVASVPAPAVRVEGGTSFVFRERDGVAERVPIVVGERSADQVEVVDGLETGDRVVVEGLVELADGDPIREGEAHLVLQSGPTAPLGD